MTDDTYLIFENEIDEAIKRTGQLLDFADVDDEGMTDEQIADIYDDRHHCGVCITRFVMESVWPSVERYIDALKTRIIELENFSHE